MPQDEPKMALWWPKIAPNWPKIGPRSLRMTEDRPKLAKIASRRENIVFHLFLKVFRNCLGAKMAQNNTKTASR